MKNEFVAQPIPSDIEYVLLEVIEDTWHDKIHSPELKHRTFLPKGYKTWHNKKKYEYNDKTIYPENNRYGGNFPKRDFKIIEQLVNFDVL